MSSVIAVRCLAKDIIAFRRAELMKHQLVNCQRPINTYAFFPGDGVIRSQAAMVNLGSSIRQY